MSKLVVAGNEVIPAPIIITASGSTITAKDGLDVLLNIASSGASVTLSNGTDNAQHVTFINANNTYACSIVYVGINGTTTKTLNKGGIYRLIWVGSYWYAMEMFTISGKDLYGTSFTETNETIVALRPQADIDYSTSETDTGKLWIDGKNIYRKCWYDTMPAAVNTSKTINHGITGIDRVISLHGFINVVSGGTYNGGFSANYYYSSSNYACLWCGTSTTINLITATSGALNQPVTIIMEYTKN